MSQIAETYNRKNIGLYRDDGLAVFKNISGPQSEKIKKQIQKIFKNNGLDITIECNIKIVNYLDVTFNLNDSSYRPYHKPDNIIKYIHVESNHPPNIIKEIPKTIEKRLSRLSSNENIFNEAATYYEEKLEESGHKIKLKYQQENIQNNTSNRKRKIIWFNPPYNKSVESKIAKIFLKLVDKHFPNHHRLHKIFNRNSLKVSYSCTKNMKSIINNHNSTILKKVTTPTDKKTCNCIKKDECPLNEYCLTENVIYKASITSTETNYEPKVYIGLAETTFKKRYANHKKSMNHKKYENETELSKEYWKIKEHNHAPKLTWEIIKQSTPYNPSSKKCYLCLNEKLEIATYENDNLLNKRTELISKCRHLNKFTLQRHDSND